MALPQLKESNKKLEDINDRMKQSTRLLQSFMQSLMGIEPARLSADLDRYRKALAGSFDRGVAAAMLAWDEHLLEWEGNKNVPVSSADRQLITEAAAYARDLEARANKLEASLTRDDVKRITADNPDSIYARIGRYFSGRSKCDLDKYYAMRAKVRFSELARGGEWVGAYVSVVESPHRKDYRKRMRDLLSTDPRFAQQKALARERYGEPTEAIPNPLPGLVPTPKNEGEKKRLQMAQIQEMADGITKAGTKPADVPAYVARLAGASPDCLADIDIGFIDLYRAELTQKRARYFLKLLKERFTKAGKVAEEDFENMSLDRTDPIYGSEYDGWKHPMQFERDGKMIRLFSGGKYGKGHFLAAELAL